MIFSISLYMHLIDSISYLHLIPFHRRENVRKFEVPPTYQANGIVS